MDSEDEYNSSQGSEDEFMEDQDSDLSLDEGDDGECLSVLVSQPCANLSLWPDSDIDIDENDIGFESQDKDIKSGRQAYEVDFIVYGPEQIQSHQDNQIKEVSSILGQPAEAAAILLRHARWNKERLIESYMDKMEEVLESAGLGESTSEPPKIEKLKGFVCDICCEDEPGLDTFAMKCSHRFCVDCYKHYLATKIKDEGEAARIRCPGDGCNKIVDSKSLDLLVSNNLKDRYVINL